MDQCANLKFGYYLLNRTHWVRAHQKLRSFKMKTLFWNRISVVDANVLTPRYFMQGCKDEHPKKISSARLRRRERFRILQRFPKSKCLTNKVVKYEYHQLRTSHYLSTVVICFWQIQKFPSSRLNFFAAVWMEAL